MPRREQPLEPGDDVVLRFARDLRLLRLAAGSPTYRQLSARAHYSAAALSEAASGRKLPSLAVTLAYVNACAGDQTEWEARWRAIATDIASSNGAERRDRERDQAPYVGLAAFEPHDADLFFGRDRLINELLARVRENRFVGLFGASGSGKSSILRAGLLPRLTQDQAVIFTPGSHPIEECAVHLAAALGTLPAALRTELAADPANLHLHIRQSRTDQPGNGDLVLVVDQFEEIFTRTGADERAWLISALTEAAFAETSRSRVVLGVRADFYGHCARHPELVEALRDAQVLVGPMTADELRQAITEPSLRVGCRVETALVARLIADASGQPAALPLVSHALLETWRHRHGTTLTLAGYESVGGIQHAISRTAEDLYGTLDAGQQEVARQIFLRLTALGEGTEDTSRRISRAELDNDDPDTGTVLDRLAQARLVTLDRNSVELTHEAVIRHWPRLRDWLTRDRDGLRIHRELTEAADAWESLDRDPGALYRGVRLAVTQEWAAAQDPALTPREREFLRGSLAARAGEHLAAQRRARRLRRLVALLAVLLVLATATTTFAIRAQQTATRQRNAALAEKVLREAAAARATNPALALQLTLAAYRLDPSPWARGNLLSLFATPYATRLTSTSVAPSEEVAISPNGRLLALAGSPTRLVDISDPFRPRELATISTLSASVAFSPDGRVLAIAYDTDPAQLWEVTDPSRPRQRAVLGGFGGSEPSQGDSIAFSPDGRVLTVSDPAGMTQLWSVTGPNPVLLSQLPRSTPAAAGPDSWVAFSPDGHVLATGSPDQSVQLWDIADAGHPERLAGVRGLAVAFSPDGRVLATAGVDTTAQLWNLTDPRNPQLLANVTGHTQTVSGMAFSPDGHTFATAGADRTTRLWDLTDHAKPNLLGVLTGHDESVLALAFSPDGRTLVTTSLDGTARLADVSQFVLASHTAAVVSLAFDHGGHTLASAGTDGTVRLWDVTDQRRPRQSRVLNSHGFAAFGSDGRVLDVRLPSSRFLAISPDGRTAVITNAAGTRLWDISDPNDPRDVSALSTYASAATFRPDGGVLAVHDLTTRSTRLLDMTEPDHPRTLASLPVNTISMAFSPDGRLLAQVGRFDRVIRVWDVTDPRNPNEAAILPGVPVPADADGGHMVAFDPTGRILATVGDRTVRLWDIADPRLPTEAATLIGHTSDVLAVAFSPDGTTIATAGNDHVIRLWETDIERLEARICAIAHPRITPAEWDRYFPGIDYQPPCR